MSGYAVNPGAVGRWLASAGLPVAPPVTIAPLGAGESNLTFLAADTAGARWVLRRPPLGPRLATAHDMAREYRVLRALHDNGATVPRPFGLVDDPAVADAPVLVTEYVPGVVLGDEAQCARLGPGARRTAAFTLVDGLARVHAIDVDAAGLGTFARRAPYAPRQVNRWQRQLAEAAPADRERLGDFAALLSRQLPAESAPTIVHGDCHLLNALFAADGRLLAIIDWELSTLGDPLADLGTLLAYWPEPDDPVPPGPYRQSADGGFPTRAELVERYAAASGRDPGPVGFWEALAAWKIAAISVGVRDRRRAAGAAREAVDSSDELITTMLRRAEFAAARAGLR